MPGLRATLLVLVFCFAGCSGGSGDTDIWSDVTSIDQLNGAWHGTYSTSMTVKHYFELGETTWTDLHQGFFGDMKIEINIEQYLWQINANAKTVSEMEILTHTFSGGNINAAWDILKNIWKQDAIINEEDHSLTFSLNWGPDPFDLDDHEVQINQTGNKIKRFVSWFGEDRKEYKMTRQEF